MADSETKPQHREQKPQQEPLAETDSSGTWVKPEPRSRHASQGISGLRAKALKAVGLVSLGLGFAGLVLPLLPTTPFILLSGWCFARSSPHWHKWIHEHREFGPLIENWQRDRSVSLRHKLVAALIILSSIGFIWMRDQPPFWIKVAVSSGLSSIFGFLLFTKTSPSRR